ncbi:hypothetical protein FACS189476_11420 [Spirochaetia bacterium]|nr:hypothetical protein FACS189476_11420 [Spirochaetia bacterium]
MDTVECAEIIERAKNMVEFIGKACGENCEVVLQDLREDRRCVVAIANGHISGRSVGAPLTDFALRLLAQETWKTTDYVCNYKGKTMDNRQLRSSTYFIKHQGRLLAMLCINIDTAKYTELSDSILRLAGLGAAPTPQQEAEFQTEKFYESMEEIIISVLKEMGLERQNRGRLTQDEKLTIVERLMDHGIFLLRGSVSNVAEKLNCSEVTIYRYITMINKRNARNPPPRL